MVVEVEKPVLHASSSYDLVATICTNTAVPAHSSVQLSQLTRQIWAFLHAHIPESQDRNLCVDNAIPRIVAEGQCPQSSSTPRHVRFVPVASRATSQKTAIPTPHCTAPFLFTYFSGQVTHLREVPLFTTKPLCASAGP